MKMEELVKNRLSDNGDIRVGIDVGSTTVKLVITDINTDDVVYSKYVRHNARQIDTTRNLLSEVKELLSGENIKAAVCG